MGPIGHVGLRAIARYRTSALAERSAGCCRFTPTCSHYAEQALHERNLLVALFLILRRVVRCRATVPMGTVDRVGSRTSMTKVRAVLLLSAIVTVGTAGLAEAVKPMVRPERLTITQGGCIMTINGGDVSRFNRNHPLVVHKGQRIQVAGLAPQVIRNAPEPADAHSYFRFEIDIVDPFTYSETTPQATGVRQFDTSRNVDQYLKYGAGLYRVNGAAEGIVAGKTVYRCDGTFYIKMDGNTAAGFIAGALAAAGVAGAATSSGKTDWATGDVVPEDPDGPTTDQIATSATGDAVKELTPDRKANQQNAVAAFGCFAVLIGYLFGTDGGDAGFAMMAATADKPKGRRVWRRGHPIRGFFSGLFMGLGLTVFMQQRGYWILTWQNTIAVPLALAVLFAFKGWRGKAFVEKSTAGSSA
ncbi:MAG: rane protein insertion efficiency factor YidD [Frankiales bacterium]|nr:rane protein insertion efficiency factor YidD [Frankiales bacterium]